MFLCLSQINHLDKHPSYIANIRLCSDLAAYCGTIENGSTFGPFEGDSGGRHVRRERGPHGVLCCKGRKLSQYAFCPVRKESEIDMPEDLAFVVMNSGVVAEKPAPPGQVQRRRQAGAAIVQLVNEHLGHRFACLAERGPQQGRRH